MTALVQWDGAGRWKDVWICQPDIQRVLRAKGASHGEWEARELNGAADVLTALSAYAEPIGRLGLSTPVDGMALPQAAPSTWRRHCARRSGVWRAERTAFVLVLDGSLLLHLRSRNGQCSLLCETGDWLLVPPDVECHLDGGEQPDFDVLSLCMPSRRSRMAPTSVLPSMDEVVAELIDRVGFGVDMTPEACPLN